jgi:streptothricin acetyltransferase
LGQVCRFVPRLFSTSWRIIFKSALISFAEDSCYKRKKLPFPAAPKRIPMLTIQELSPASLPAAGRLDNSFTVDSRLVLSAAAGQISYTVRPVAPFRKVYPPEDVDYTAYLHNPQRTVYLVYLDGQLAGQIRLGTKWNQFGEVEDLTVDPPFRRCGVGQALLTRAQEWARAHNLPGLCLETQDINTAACRLYARCGFVLCGFDRCLYHATLPGTDEIALYWYWLTDGA